MKKSIICLLLLLLAVCLALTACGGKSNNSAAEPEEPTLEKWMAEHPEQLKGVQSADGLEYSFKKNTLIYKYDLSITNAQLSEEVAKSDIMKKALEDGITNGEDTFKGIIDNLEKNTGISGINVEIIYTWKDTVLVDRFITK